MYFKLKWKNATILSGKKGSRPARLILTRVFRRAAKNNTCVRRECIMKNIEKMELTLKAAIEANAAEKKAAEKKAAAEKAALNRAVKAIGAALKKDSAAFDNYQRVAGAAALQAGRAWNVARAANVSEKTLSAALADAGYTAMQISRVRKAARVAAIIPSDAVTAASVRVIMDAADALKKGVEAEKVAAALQEKDSRAALDEIMPQNADAGNGPARKGAAAPRKNNAVDDTATKAAGFYQVVRDAMKAAGVAADNHAYDALAALASLAGMPANLQ